MTAKITAKMTPGLEKWSQCVGGVWMPKTEVHFPEMMEPGTKRFRQIDGRWTYQYHKLERCVAEIKKAGRSRGVCIDVGAHCGLWSMWLVRAFKFVHAFEPVWLHADLFEVNVEGENWELHRTALGNHSGVVSIETAATQTGSAHVVMAGREGDMRTGHGEMLTYPDIEMVPLDHYKFPAVDFIKIDVEGYELPMLEGARDTLIRCKPWIVVEQKGNDRKGYGWKEHEAQAWLKKLGWTDVKVIAGDHIMRPPR